MHVTGGAGSAGCPPVLHWETVAWRQQAGLLGLPAGWGWLPLLGREPCGASLAWGPCEEAFLKESKHIGTNVELSVALRKKERKKLLKPRSLDLLLIGGIIEVSLVAYCKAQ